MKFTTLPTFRKAFQWLTFHAMVWGQLTKEDEAALGDEIEVRRQDQEKINEFSRLNQREQVIEEELAAEMPAPGLFARVGVLLEI